MDITSLAAWGEFIGGIAVVVSLVYLAVQIRVNTKTVRASNLGEQMAASSEWSRMILDPARSVAVRAGDGGLRRAQHRGPASLQWSYGAPIRDDLEHPASLSAGSLRCRYGRE
jgi:hypothetical protein